MAAEDARRLPPQSLEAEESVLGGAMLDNTAIDRVLEFVRPDDFYREAHRRIFRAMLALAEKNEPVDLVTLSEVLRQRGELQDVGGCAHPAELAARVATAAHAAHYPKIGREKASLR